MESRPKKKKNAIHVKHGVGTSRRVKRRVKWGHMNMIKVLHMHG
jgi:hypothetical protein